MTTARVTLRLGLVVTLALAAGCGGYTGLRPEALQKWVGRPATSLQKDWGPATREVEDGDLRILVYEEMQQKGSYYKGGFETENQDPSRYRQGGADYVAAAEAAQKAYRAPTVYVRSYLFWVDREGTIVNSAVRTP